MGFLGNEMGMGWLWEGGLWEVWGCGWGGMLGRGFRLGGLIAGHRLLL